MSRGVGIEEYGILVQKHTREYNFILPVGSIIVHIQNRGSEIIFSVMHDPFEEQVEQRRFLILESGEDFEKSNRDNLVVYIGAAQMDDGYTLYILEELPPPSHIKLLQNPIRML